MVLCGRALRPWRAPVGHHTDVVNPRSSTRNDSLHTVPRTRRVLARSDVIRTQQGHWMVTEDDVRSYGYQRQVFLDGRNAKGKFAIQVSACSSNPRLVVVWNSQK